MCAGSVRASTPGEYRKSPGELASWAPMGRLGLDITFERGKASKRSSLFRVKWFTFQV
jgi:hypothetical protein